MENTFTNVANQSPKPMQPQEQKVTQVTPKQAEVTDKKELSPRGHRQTRSQGEKRFGKCQKSYG